MKCCLPFVFLSNPLVNQIIKSHLQNKRPVEKFDLDWKIILNFQKWKTDQTSIFLTSFRTVLFCFLNQFSNVVECHALANYVFRYFMRISVFKTQFCAYFTFNRFSFPLKFCFLFFENIKNRFRSKINRLTTIPRSITV